MPCRTVGLRQQRGAASPTWFKHLLINAAAYLLGYASDDKHWPLELRPAGTANKELDKVLPESIGGDAIQ